METERIALSQRERDRLRVLHEVQQEGDHADRSRQAAEDQRLPYPSAAVASGGTRRPSGDPWITRTKIKPQVSRVLGAEDFTWRMVPPLYAACPDFQII